MYVYVIHYLELKGDTDDIKDKIWLNANYEIAKGFFNIRKDMIDKAIGKKERILTDEKRGYYHTLVKTPGDGFTFISYTLSMQRKKVQFLDESDFTI